MKKFILVVCILSISLLQAQSTETTFEKENDLVKATYFHENGQVKEQGFFKDKKLTGTWISFNEKGIKTTIAHYEAGKKVGKWFMWKEDGLKEIDYNNNVIASVQTWKEETKMAIK
ncbi:toxin-antitoxin system YwqK family antitoxin [Tenacibaculum finnmarkense]|uniref:toxin-antitoxin system YwqK family antitoxin n=1 Tax=Tenacibaculum finnmarkense TaxID=2781243 RepID=UPI00187B1599|nr:nicotinic acid mononucleotide adenyltransferase [Tenacibaculum finnmarkense]MBE7633257.1 nicotinic acid mononucleotide adenyltransferase [Tenacibaculum finnmarkense genomovar ulcerans]MBE7644891.1 nicotinic acid mononucleotide adenyltransferase [Tenacibaculum finnmarkense genomovar ulcerans]MBE7647054.1 nicotinic acid mononucleotide adenyltransferase [Tenacibaculum finnmarkense genomovar ulcerans]MBE7686830.1 nicotinic acid mononucleotide adenyltransferase [Tenacibaculum finnmarkense genomov